jgi:hypothetical protein
MVKPKIMGMQTKKQKILPEMLTEKRKTPWGKRVFRAKKFYKPLKRIESGINISQATLFRLDRNSSLYKKLNELKKRIRPKLKIRRTDNISFFEWQGKYYLEAFSKGKKFYQLFEIKDEKAIEALEYIKREMKK